MASAHAFSPDSDNEDSQDENDGILPYQYEPVASDSASESDDEAAMDDDQRQTERLTNTTWFDYTIKVLNLNVILCVHVHIVL